MYFFILRRITDLNIFIRRSDLKNFHGLRTQPRPAPPPKPGKSALAPGDEVVENKAFSDPLFDFVNQQPTKLSFDKHFFVMILTEFFGLFNWYSSAKEKQEAHCQDDVFLKLLRLGGGS